MKKYLWYLLILLILFPSFGTGFGLLLGIFAIPLAIIIVFVANMIDIHKATHDDDNRQK
ncbi:hypothetical protein [Lactobacillus delbrueckii]|uniref:hypothetical protein n=1 Tax=Lactobacillus delbrueckii TaxID=1584 RepID=UPI0013EEC061|nr:hypothetical protein [Lactobacillus delbrueckii]